MRSKTSLINRELTVFIFKNIGWIAILNFFGLFFALPLEILLTETNVPFRNEINNPLFIMQNVIQVTLIFVTPTALAVFLFRYLQVKQASDFIHSLPILKRRLYFQQLCTGLIFLAVPIILIAVFLFCFHFFMDIDHLYRVEDIIEWTTITLLLEVLIFSVAVCIGMITGISALQVVLTFISLLLPTGLYILIVSNLKFFLTGFSEDYYLNNLTWHLSPLTITENLGRTSFSSVDIIFYFGASIWFMLLAYFLYKKRRNEFVSESFVFPIIKPLFKYGLITCSMLISGMYFGAMKENLTWLFLGYFLGSILGFYIAEFILQKTWRIQFRFVGLGYFGVAVALILIIIKLDLLNYHSSIPDIANVKQVYMNSYYENNQLSEEEDVVYIRNAKNIQDIKNLHEKIVEYGEFKPFRSKDTTSIYFIYQLTDGKKIIREYHLTNGEKYRNALKKIYETEEHKKIVQPLLSVKAKNIYRINVSAIGPFQKSVEIRDPNEIREALELLQQDLLAETYEEMQQELGVQAYVDFTLDNYEHAHLSWKPAYKRFNSWMEDKGYAERAKVANEDIAQIKIEKFDSIKSYPYERSLIEENEEEDVLTMKHGPEMQTVFDSSEPGILERDYVVIIYYKGFDYIEYRSLNKVDAPAFINDYFN